MENNDNLDFQKVFDDENDIYNDNHYCEYVETNQISKLTKTEYFSSFSHNVRSLPGHFDGLIDLLDEAKPHIFFSNSFTGNLEHFKGFQYSKLQ